MILSHQHEYELETGAFLSHGLLHPLALALFFSDAAMALATNSSYF